MKTADDIIMKVFGGIRPMARALGCSHVTVASWRQRKRIPAGRWRECIEAAEINNLDLTLEDLMNHAA